MGTDQILDLFNLGETTDIPQPSGDGVEREEDMVDVTGKVREKGKKNMFDGMEELWDERQYAEEYNLDSYLQKMN